MAAPDAALNVGGVVEVSTMRRRMILIAMAVSIVIGACSSAPLPSPTILTQVREQPRTTLPPATASPAPVGGGCGSTHVLTGPGPDAALGLASNPWAAAAPADAGVVAYFWYPPPDLLFAPGPNGNKTKILWISHDGQADHLTIVAQPLSASLPLVRFDVPPASSPSNNYPSAIALPSPGCWHLELALGATRATMDVLVAP